MAQSRHQRLATQMRLMIRNIEEYCAEILSSMNFIQVHFYEKMLIRDRPLMSQSVLRAMIYTHCNGMKVLCPCAVTKIAFQTLPLFGAITESPTPRNSITRKTYGWFIPWGVITTLPTANVNAIDKCRGEIFLYCPSKDELPNHIDLYEKEDAANTFTQQFFTIIEEMKQEEIFKKNLDKSPTLIFKDAIQDWCASNLKNNCDVVNRSPRKLEDTDFAPRTDYNIALAYEAVLKSLHNDTFKHRQNLRRIYKDKLEKAMFEGITWPEFRCKARLKEWHENLFKGELTVQKTFKNERWPQSNCTNRHTAAQFLQYFCNRFINDSSDEVAGEVACALWISLWCAQDENSETIRVQDVIELSAQQVNSDRSLQIAGRDIEISSGLYELLCCLVGKAKKRSRRLFSHIKHRKALERVLKEASLVLLGEHAIPVSPKAFLIWPHVSDSRLSQQQREAERHLHRSVSPRHLRHNIIRALKAVKHS